MASVGNITPNNSISLGSGINIPTFSQSDIDRATSDGGSIAPNTLFWHSDLMGLYLWAGPGTGLIAISGMSVSGALTILGRFTNYSALVAAHPAPISGSLAYVNEAEGTQWLPGSLGGSYRARGFYIYSGTEWVSDRNQISNALSVLTGNEVQSGSVSGDTMTLTKEDGTDVEINVSSLNNGNVSNGVITLNATQGELTISDDNSFSLNQNDNETFNYGLADALSGSLVGQHNIADIGSITIDEKGRVTHLSTSAGPTPVSTFDGRILGGARHIPVGTVVNEVFRTSGTNGFTYTLSNASVTGTGLTATINDQSITVSGGSNVAAGTYTLTVTFDWTRISDGSTGTDTGSVNLIVFRPYYTGTLDDIPTEFQPNTGLTASNVALTSGTIIRDIRRIGTGDFDYFIINIHSSFGTPTFAYSTVGAGFFFPVRLDPEDMIVGTGGYTTYILPFNDPVDLRITN